MNNPQKGGGVAEGKRRFFSRKRRRKPSKYKGSGEAEIFFTTF